MSLIFLHITQNFHKLLNLQQFTTLLYIIFEILSIYCCEQIVKSKSYSQISNNLEKYLIHFLSLVCLFDFFLLLLVNFLMLLSLFLLNLSILSIILSI